MELKDELKTKVHEIFASQWTERDGNVVPSDNSIKLSNDAVKLDATVLYADMADSTKLVDGHTARFAAEIYKAFLYSAARIIRNESGEITAYDGDRVMAVFLGKTKNTSAVRAALKIKCAVNRIINPAWKTRSYAIRHVVGIDTSPLFVAKTGARGANDLVWVGRAANYAAKLSALQPSYTYITKEVYSTMLEEARTSKGVNMWEQVVWTAFDSRTIYRSSWQWEIV